MTAPELLVGQLLYALCSGGASLADAERLNDEPLVRQLARVPKFADQTQLGEWLRKQTDASVAAFWRLIAEFVQWVLECADAARWTYAGWAEVFFDDTQIEVFGPSFEGAQINYNGDRALSWQTLWFGPFLLGGQLGSPGDVGGALPQLLQQHRGLWQHRECDFLADSGSSSAAYLQAIDQAGFTHWSVSYNRWTTVPERTAAALPEKVWSAAAKTRWRDGRGSHRTTRRGSPHPDRERVHFPAGRGALEERRRDVLALRLRGARPAPHRRGGHYGAAPLEGIRQWRCLCASRAGRD